MEAFITSTAVVALAEVGDKTQLLALVLATRFKRPWPIVAGIFVATLVNHFLAALVGAEAAFLLDSQWFRYLIALSFIGMAIWTLVPDKLDDANQTPPAIARFWPRWRPSFWWSWETRPRLRPAPRAPPSARGRRGAGPP